MFSASLKFLCKQLFLGNVGTQEIVLCFQAIFSVTKPDVDIFLVVRVEKILQGSISAAVDQYLRTTDQKTGTKIHKSMKQYCQRLGRYHMPFVWAVR